MWFLDFADQAMAQGIGRHISEEEAIAILEANQKDGLVLMPSNTQEVQFVCSCCPDCCGALRGLRATERPAEKAISNFYSSVEADLCTGCGSCAEMCPMDAIGVDTGTAEIDLVRCIGCGVCVPQCATEAIHLQRKEQVSEPPKTWDDLYEDMHRIAGSEGSA
jgi:ferredoxin